MNRITADIKRGLLDGLLTCDYALDPNDKDAPGSISTYMRTVANKHPELFFSAVVKLLPRELHTSLSTGYQCGRYVSHHDEVQAGYSRRKVWQQRNSPVEAYAPTLGSRSTRGG